MPLTAIDPCTALVIIDLQQGIGGAPWLPAIGPVVQNSRALAAVFRRHRLPVVLVNVVGTAPGRTERAPRHPASRPARWSDLLPELDRQADDLVISKRTWGAFAGTDLEPQLKARKMTQVVITGVATATGVESTARQAYELGFNVTSRHRRHGRPAPGRTRQQHHERVSTAGRNRDHRGHHRSACNEGLLT